MKTKLSKVWFTPSPIVAAGTNAATATLLDHPLEQLLFTVSGADGAKGVIVPPVTSDFPGRALYVHNAGSGDLFIYPNSGASIDVGSADQPMTLPTLRTVMLIGISSTQWAGIISG